MRLFLHEERNEVLFNSEMIRRDKLYFYGVIGHIVLVFILRVFII